MAESAENPAPSESPAAPIAGETAPTSPAPAGPEAARIALRTAAYCVVCDRIVERQPDGTCPAGHPPDTLTGALRLEAGEPVPQLPRFSIAAFFLPPVWGPAHGLWVGAIFLPIWLFADGAVAAASRGGIAAVGAVTVGVLTFAFQAFFAKRANGLAWSRVCDRMGIEEFVRRERVWTYVCVPLGIALLGWATYYQLVLA